MASTSITLGSRWEEFVSGQLKSGRYSSASEVIRAGLRALEEKETRFEALRAHVLEGVAEADRGSFVETSAADVLKRAKARQD